MSFIEALDEDSDVELIEHVVNGIERPRSSALRSSSETAVSALQSVQSNLESSNLGNQEHHQLAQLSKLVQHIFSASRKRGAADIEICRQSKFKRSGSQSYGGDAGAGASSRASIGADMGSDSFSCMVCKREAGAALTKAEQGLWGGLASQGPLTLELAMLSACEHVVCKPCMVAQVEQCVTNRSLLVQCPVSLPLRSSSSSSSVAVGMEPCGALVQQLELTDAMTGFSGSARLQSALERECVESAIRAAGGKLVQCPGCHAECEFIEAGAGSIGGGMQRDEAGRPLTTAATRHRDKHRMRCRTCDVNWCTQCEIVPYHLGMGCEEHETRRSAVKCRYCDESLPGKSEIVVRSEESALYNAASASSGEEGVDSRRGSASSVRSVVVAVEEHPPARKALMLRVCWKPECLERANGACAFRHRACGHACGGIRGEGILGSPSGGTHLACLREVCKGLPGVTEGDYCGVCYTEGLSAAPCLQLACGHVVHAACIRKAIGAGHFGARISFNHTRCPLCRKPAGHASLQDVLRPWQRLEADVRALAIARLKFEGVPANEPLLAAGGKYHGNPEDYAVDRFAFYVCGKCARPYFGGARVCGEAPAPPAGVLAGPGAIDGGLLCPACKPPVPGAKACSKHGAEHLDFKCRFCCSPAVWFCFKTTHFCEGCHKAWCLAPGRIPVVGCPQLAGTGTCPLGVAGGHPENNKDDKGEFSLGCSACCMEKAGVSGPL